MHGHFLRFPVPPRASLALPGAEDGHAVLTVDDHGLSVHLNSSSTTNLVGPVHGGQDFGVTLITPSQVSSQYWVIFTQVFGPG